MKPVRGTGSASAHTITNWSALATSTRSAGSVSSADRRSTLRRGEIRTIRARVSGLPSVSPTRSTRSPTATARRPSSRARIAVTTCACLLPSSTRQVYRPRSTVVTNPVTASVWVGLVFVRGRELRVGRTRTSSLSQFSPSVLSWPPPTATGRRQHLLPHQVKARQRLGGGGDVVDQHAGDPQPDDRPRRRHPMICVGAPGPAVQRAGRDGQRVGRFLHDCRRGRGCRWRSLPTGRFRGPGGGRSRTAGWTPSAKTAIAAMVGVSSPTSCRSMSMPASAFGPVTVSPSGLSSTIAPIAARMPRMASPA